MGIVELHGDSIVCTMHAIANNMGGLHVGFFMLMLQQLVLASAAEQQQQQQTYYVLDDSSGLGRRFDGIGGLSAGVKTHDYVTLTSAAPRPLSL